MRINLPDTFLRTFAIAFAIVAGLPMLLAVTLALFGMDPRHALAIWWGAQSFTGVGFLAFIWLTDRGQ